jgi:hypothetical protein|tara:strand:+ start:454 stop:1287 length:834 start_codon:yes stop_codon:yes gene_type:complete
MINKADIEQSQAINASAKQWAIAHLDYLNKPMALFGSSNKVEKGADKFDTYIMYLQPADKVAAATLCAAAESSGCKAPCLISSGQLGMSTGQNAATKRTVLMLLRPDLFAGQLLKEIDKAERKALKTSIPALFRLNGTSDLDWSHIINKRPASMFYDYSKVLSNVRKNTLANYDLTYSASMYSKQSRAAFKKAVKAGHRIAVAFNTKGLASDELQISHQLASFDKTDLRHLDGQVIGTLTRKGSSKAVRAADNLQANSFFVTAANLVAFNDIIAIGG